MVAAVLEAIKNLPLYEKNFQKKYLRNYTKNNNYFSAFFNKHFSQGFQLQNFPNLLYFYYLQILYIFFAWTNGTNKQKNRHTHIPIFKTRENISKPLKHWEIIIQK